MKILVYPHSMAVGGSQLNAIELAAAVRDRGHDVAVFGQAGPLLDLVHDLGLGFVSSPEPRRRPSSAVVRALRLLAHAEDFDIMHGYEWPPALECHAAAIGSRAATVCTVMSMGIAPFIPSTIPLVVGTQQLQTFAASRRRGPVTLIEPPVDTDANKPGVSTSEFSARHGLDSADLHVVVVSRLAVELKMQGLLEAVSVVGRVAQDVPVRLVIVGDGPARSAVASAAAEVNGQSARPVVVMTGELIDPRPAYALADVALGMGGSALRAMAFERPLVVQGERGFWQELNAESAQRFLVQGWYGIGDGSSGEAKLEAILRRLLTQAEARRVLGIYGRRLVEERFSLPRAARIQEDVYAEAIIKPSMARSIADSVPAAGRLALHDARLRFRRLVGRDIAEDFNAVTAQPGGGARR